MRTGLIGKKIGSSSYFDNNGMMIPVTLVKIDVCIVSDIKTKEKPPSKPTCEIYPSWIKNNQEGKDFEKFLESKSNIVIPSW